MIFDQLNKDLLASEIDTELSGSTCIVVLITPTHIYTANVGDSRAILARKNESNSRQIKCIRLSVDQKPSLESERQRILSFGGRILS